MKIDQIMRDLGSANEIIAPDLQRQLGGEVIKSRRAKAEKDPIAGLMGGEKVLNAELARLEQSLADSRERLHLRPENLQRVVETAFELNNLPPLELVGSEDTDVPVFRLPNLDNSWEQVNRGLYTRLDPDNPRPIAFDPQVLSEDPDVVYMHLGSPAAPAGNSAPPLRPLGRRPGVGTCDRHRRPRARGVVRRRGHPPRSCRSRRPPPPRGSLPRRHPARSPPGGRRAACRGPAGIGAGPYRPRRMPPEIATQIAAAWNAEGADGLRARVQQAIDDRAVRRRKDVEAHLIERRETDRARVDEIFDRFEQTLREALSEAEAIDGDPQLGLFEDERRQSERDLREIRRRIDALGDERDRELAAVDTRYDDIRTWEFPAAVIFALAPRDLENGLAIR